MRVSKSLRSDIIITYKEVDYWFYGLTKKQAIEVFTNRLKKDYIASRVQFKLLLVLGLVKTTVFMVFLGYLILHL